MPQLMFEVIYETKGFNDVAMWPADGSQPFVYSFGDETGFANHGDYLFGWKDDSLQKIMDEECYVGCASMKTQSMQAMNSCSVTRKVDEDVGDSTCRSRSSSLCGQILTLRDSLMYQYAAIPPHPQSPTSALSVPTQQTARPRLWCG
jgi:hypothetical protein